MTPLERYLAAGVAAGCPRDQMDRLVRASVYLGLEYDVIGIEEATTLSPRKHLDISTCSRTSKPNWRPRIYSTSNPGGVGHAWYREKFIVPYRAGRETETRFIPARVDDNRFNNPEYAKSQAGPEAEAGEHGAGERLGGGVAAFG